MYNIILYRRGPRKVPQFLLREQDGGDGSHNGRVGCVGCKLTQTRRDWSLPSDYAVIHQAQSCYKPFPYAYKSNSIKFDRIGT